MAPVTSFKLRSGKSIPWLAYGNGSGAARDVAEKTTRQAIEAGFVHFDTAQGYIRKQGESNEAVLGDAIRESGRERNSLYVVTKISQEGGDASKPPLTLEEFTSSIKGSLKNLGSQPDLVLIHSPKVCDGGKRIGEYWQALEKLVQDGTLTADLGFSNFHPSEIEEVERVAKIKPVVHQLEWHPMVLTANQRIWELHEQYGIVTAAYGPLSPVLADHGGGRLKPVLDKIAKARQIEPSEVLLLWCKAMGIVAVTTTSKKERIENLVKLEGKEGLSKAEVEEINEVGKQLHYRRYDEHMLDLPVPDLPSQ